MNLFLQLSWTSVKTKRKKEKGSESKEIPFEPLNVEASSSPWMDGGAFCHRDNDTNNAQISIFNIMTGTYSREKPERASAGGWAWDQEEVQLKRGQRKGSGTERERKEEPARRLILNFSYPKAL